MRLTPSTIHEAPQGLNCLGDRELTLRNLAIPAIENLAVARDGFDLIDLSCNQISTLGDGFPPFRRLRSLYLASNRIARITAGLADSLPNLRVLVLSHNRIADLAALNLPELARLPLDTLCITGNGVTGAPDARRRIVAALGSLKVLDFTRVTRAERVEAGAGVGNGSRSGRKRKRERGEGAPAKRTRSGGDEEVPEEVSRMLREYIERAKSVEEVLRVQEAIRDGRAVEFVEKARAGKVQVGEVQADEMQADEVQAEEVQAGNVQAVDVQAEGVPAEDVPAGDMPAGDMPAGDVPEGNLLAGNVPAGAVHAEEMHVDDVKAEEVQAKDGVQPATVKAEIVQAGAVQAEAG